MALDLMYITNQPEIAKLASEAGVNRIFVDMEYIGKDIRQANLDTVQNHHTIDDIKEIHQLRLAAQTMARINPIYEHSIQEINESIEAGAEILMLPYFKNPREVKTFVDAVQGRAKVSLLLETKEAVENLPEIVAISGIDEIHIGLNDLHLSYGNQFMFEPMTNGLVEHIVAIIKSSPIKRFGIGGISRLGTGKVPAEMIICEHYRLGSSQTILSRSFLNLEHQFDLNQAETIFQQGVAEIREFEAEIAQKDDLFYDNAHQKLVQAIADVVGN
ncbi:MAG: aldolase [Streptococcaceae bacterium]|jgi:2-keto-3-deoxy-L-rhamnonate aldolase RhmA|nr:aldolase [Streptococcaceae bacterium]